MNKKTDSFFLLQMFAMNRKRLVLVKLSNHVTSSTEKQIRVNNSDGEGARPTVTTSDQLRNAGLSAKLGRLKPPVTNR